MFLSDGSVCNGPVGYGACAVVLFPNMNNGDTQIVTKPIRNMVCSEKCEMEGVILGLEMSVEYLRCTVSSVTNQQEAQLNARGGRPYCPQSYKYNHAVRI